MTYAFEVAWFGSLALGATVVVFNVRGLRDRWVRSIADKHGSPARVEQALRVVSVAFLAVSLAILALAAVER